MEPFLIPQFRPVPTILARDSIPRGAGRCLLLIVAHADDPAIFVGGVIALWAHAGWRIHALRATDDRWDSVNVAEGETIDRNAREFREAAKLLGIDTVEDLMWPTDMFGNADRVALRAALIRTIRREKPYALMTFDANSMFFEDNLDHKVLAEAADEAFWTAMFDKHHPEHRAEGLEPHGCVERWYFGRTVAAVTHVVDTSSVIETQLEAVLCHRTPLENMAHQYALQARTAGLGEDRIAAVLREPGAAVVARLRDAAAEKGRPFGLAAAEYLRCHAARL